MSSSAYLSCTFHQLHYQNVWFGGQTWQCSGLTPSSLPRNGGVWSEKDDYTLGRWLNLGSAKCKASAVSAILWLQPTIIFKTHFKQYQPVATDCSQISSHKASCSKSRAFLVLLCRFQVNRLVAEKENQIVEQSPPAHPNPIWIPST